ncbi:cysteine hydrolase family protein [Portibacter lacus]|uniref:Isochorismatase n=1 Tax=Portibacter lacus TaxID=1099794 RepID=A0AA37SNZ5_9BACT|nr:isochorismatase family protein [Portibacter lacus]GLR16419.1 isochorismatase [Portibacter lacus]
MIKALLIIDMQKGSFTEETPRYDTGGVCDRINLIAESFRKSDFPVIHIQHDSSRFKRFIPGTEEWEIIDEIHVDQCDHNIQKTANDAFYHSELETLLLNHKVSEIYITGCATDFCVESTIQSAIVKDLNIVVIQDGHTTADRPHANAKTVIDQYNFVWSNMIPTKGSLKVLSTDQVLEANAK